MPAESPGDAPRKILHVSLIGPPGFRVGDRDILLRNRKTRALLTYLILQERHEDTRGKLIGLLWSDSEEAKARASLRQALAEIRRAFLPGLEVLQAEKRSIRLAAEHLRVDIAEVLSMAAEGRAHSRLLDGRRPLEKLGAGLDECSEEFDAWLSGTRTDLAERVQRGIRPQLVAADADLREEAATALLNIDPSNEEACRTLMLSRAQRGDSPAALRIFRDLSRVLADEYGAAPHPQTVKLAEEIRAGVHAPATLPDPPVSGAAAEPARIPLRPSRIALVVPRFSLNAVTDDKLHLVEGFRHNLVACLVRFREWSVAGDVSASPSAFDASVAPYGIDGTAYQTGDVINLIVTFREIRSGEFLWSERLEVSLDRWFPAQGELVRRLAALLKVQLANDRLRQIEETQAAPRLAFDRWLRGQLMIETFDREHWRRGQDLFLSAIRAAPTFSPGYSSLAQILNGAHFAHPGMFRDRARARRALIYAMRAVELDPLDSRAQLSLAWAHAFLGDHDAGLGHAVQARRLNDNDPWTLISAAGFMAMAGDHDTAAEIALEAERVAILPSRPHMAYACFIRFLRGEYAEAIAAADRAGDAVGIVRAWKAAALQRLGFKREAAREIEVFLTQMRGHWTGPMPLSDETIGGWVLQAHPIRRAEDLARLRDAVEAAGLPTGRPPRRPKPSGSG